MTQTTVRRILSDAFSPAHKLIDPVDLETSLVHYGGFFWYRCRVETEPGTFHSGDRTRSGWVLFVPTFKNGKVAIQIHGLRLAHSTDGYGNVALEEPYAWSGKGETALEHDRFTFTWENRYDQGTNKETVLTDPLTEVWPGAFVLQDKSGEIYGGTVKYSRIPPDLHVPLEETGEPWIPVDTLPQFRKGLEPKQITAWGKRVLAALDKEAQPSDVLPFTYLDLVSKQFERANELTLIDAGKSFGQSLRDSAIYLGSADTKPLATFGRAPVR